MTKKIIISLLLFFTVYSLPVQAHEGWLAGIEASYVETDFTTRTQNVFTFLGSRLGTSRSSSNSDGWGGRAFLGYQFIPYAGVELGITKIEDVKLKNIFGVPGANVKIRPVAGDLVAKAIMPFDIYSIFAKAGIAAAHVSTSANSTAKAITTPLGTPTLPSSDTRYRPIYGIGAGIDLSQDFTLTGSWTQISGSGRIEDMTFWSLGLIYFFGK